MTVYTSRFGFQWNYQPHDTGWGPAFNYAHRAVAALLHPVITNDTLTDPPGSPAENDAYFIPSTPAGTGAWAAQNNKIAVYQGAAWQFYSPVTGFRAYIVNRAGFYWWNGATWQAEATSSGGTYVQTVAGHAPDGSGNVALVVGDITGAAPLSSPAFTGNPTATTQAANNNSTRLSTTEYVDRAVAALGGVVSISAGTGISAPYSAGVYTISVNTSTIATHTYVDTAIANLVNSAPSTMDTLGEIATLLSSDESTASALATTVAGKVAKAGDTMTGDLHLAAPAGSDNTDKAVSSAWVRTYVTGLGFGTGSGTVTSVAMTVPSDMSISGSPITSSGTLALTRNNQNANLVFAGPSTGAAAAPTYRSLVAADLPSGIGSNIPYDVGFFAEGTMTTSEVVARFVAPRALSLASGASGVAICGTAPTGSSVAMTLAKNGSNFGTVTYTSGSTTGTVSITSTTTFASGDIITWAGPGSADATLSDPSVTLTATR